MSFSKHVLAPLLFDFRERSSHMRSIDMLLKYDYCIHFRSKSCQSLSMHDYKTVVDQPSYFLVILNRYKKSNNTNRARVY